MDFRVRQRPQPTPIRGLLDDCLDQVAGQPGSGALWRVWDEAVGAQIARRAQPVRLRDRTLVVAVTSAPWMQELHMLKRTLVDAVNERLPTPLIDDLYLVLTEDRADPKPIPVRPPRVCVPPPSTPQLPDLPPALRESFTSVLAAWKRRAGRR